MTAETNSPPATMSLRDVGSRLRQIQKSGDRSPHVDRLLLILQKGELSAGFFCPTKKPRWIEIPNSFWLAIGSDKLMSLFYKDNSSTKIGAFKVRLRQFSDEIAAVLLSDPVNANDSRCLAREYTAILNLTQKEIEVRVLESLWQKYLNHQDIIDPAFRPSSKKGAKQLASWRDVAILIAVHMVQHYQSSEHKIKASIAAEDILRLAMNEQLKNPPSKSTIAEVITQIANKLEPRS